jgi:CubicO group peptidase (beta-lactamase class C family)
MQVGHNAALNGSGNIERLDGAAGCVDSHAGETDETRSDGGLDTVGCDLLDLAAAKRGDVDIPRMVDRHAIGKVKKGANGDLGRVGRHTGEGEKRKTRRRVRRAGHAGKDVRLEASLDSAVVEHRADDQGDRKLAADVTALAGRRAKSVAAAVVDLAASPKTRFAFIDAEPETRFEIGSITKALTGMLLADTVDRGEVSLDTKIGALLPGDAGTRFGSISFKELCTHTSGLPRLPRGPFTLLRGWRFALLGTDPYRGTTASGVLATAGRQRLLGRGQFRYSNLGAAVLGQLLALKEGAEFGPLISERIFAPLQMTATAVANPQQTAQPGWSPTGRRRSPWSMDGYAPAGGVISTLGDMTRLAVALLDGSAPGIGSLTPIEGVATGAPNRTRGMFWVIESLPGTDREMIWLNGQTGGYSGFLGLAPRSGRAVIVLANVARASDQRRIAFSLSRHFADHVGTDAAPGFKSPWPDH